MVYPRWMDGSGGVERRERAGMGRGWRSALWVSAFASTCVFGVEGYSSGGRCGGPGGGHGSATAGDGGFGLVATETGSGNVIAVGGTLSEGTGAVTLTFSGGSNFKGVHVSADGGLFGGVPSGYQLMSSSGSCKTAVTHTSDASKTSLAFTFTPPTTGGEVTLTTYVVKSAQNDWYGPLTYKFNAPAAPTPSTNPAAPTPSSTSYPPGVPTPSSTPTQAPNTTSAQPSSPTPAGTGTAPSGEPTPAGKENFVPTPVPITRDVSSESCLGATQTRLAVGAHVLVGLHIMSS